MFNQATQALLVGAFKKLNTQGVQATQAESNFNLKGIGFKELEVMAKKGLCPRGNYATGRALSPSSLSKFIGNPLEYIDYIQQKDFQGSEATELGNAFEEVLAHAEKANEFLHLVELPQPDKTMLAKANKEAFESALAKCKKPCVTQEGAELLTAMYKACLHKEFKLTQDLKGYDRQIKVERTCEVTGLKMLGYLDFKKDSHVVEVKTIDDINKAESRICYAPYGYWVQVAFYSYFAERVTMLFVEKKEPYGILRIDFSPEELEKLRSRFVQEVAIPFAKALDKGFYKTAGSEIKMNVFRRLKIA